MLQQNPMKKYKREGSHRLGHLLNHGFFAMVIFNAPLL